MSDSTSRAGSAPLVLLLERHSDLRGLEQVVIEGLGFAVEPSGEVQRGLDLAKQDRPSVIVLGVPYDDPAVIDVVDQLRNDPDTTTIPVVVVSTSEQGAAVAQASPNVRTTVIAPYDVAALENAVRDALHNPPPPAVLPTPPRPVPAGARHAAAELNRQARAIVLDAPREYADELLRRAVAEFTA